MATVGLAPADGSGGVGTVLAGTLTTWIQQRRADVRLTITAEDGRTIEVDAKRSTPRYRSSKGPHVPGCSRASTAILANWLCLKAPD